MFFASSDGSGVGEPLGVSGAVELGFVDGEAE